MKKTLTTRADKFIRGVLIVSFLPVLLNAGQSTVPPISDVVAEEKCVVVIDAGHGGQEPGVSARGVQEKNIALELAKKIKAKLERTGNVTALMTRSGDETLKIEDRAGFANAGKACVYISIHCDFVTTPGAEGYKVYFMEPYQETRIERQGIVKWNEVQLKHAGDSKKLATYIIQYMKAALIAETGGGDENDLVPVPSRGAAGVKTAALISLDMPAVIIEAGNMNNGNDFMNLKDSRILNQMAYHIKEGIVNYMKEERFNRGGTQQ